MQGFQCEFVLLPIVSIIALSAHLYPLVLGVVDSNLLHCDLPPFWFALW